VRRRLLGAAAALALALGACSMGPPEPSGVSLSIGVDVQLGGPDAPSGHAVLDAVNRVVADEFHGRIEGLPLTVRQFDDSANGRRDTGQGRRNLDRMVADSTLVGVLGPLNSDLAAAEIPIANAAHLVLVSPSASNSCLTKNLPLCIMPPGELRPNGPNNFFRVVASDDGEPSALLQYATNTLHATRFAVGSDGQDYGRSARAGFEAALKKAGLGPAVSADFDPNSTAAVDAFLAEAKTAGADAVFFGGREAGGACKVRARMQAPFGTTAPFLGESGIMGPTCLKDAGSMAGLYSVAAGTGSLTQQAETATRVLLRAVTTSVKAAGGNVPNRQDVTLAVSRSTDPHFDANGDTADKFFTVSQGQVSGWVPAGQIRI
jgi:branched-chain amino acid transport system substrate-binding protein